MPKIENLFILRHDVKVWLRMIFRIGVNDQAHVKSFDSGHYNNCT